MKITNMTPLLTAALLSTALLTGCSISPVESPVIKSYGILPSQSDTTDTKLIQKSKKIIYIAEMTANNPYDTTQMFYSKSTYQIQAYNYNQWMAPPAGMLTNVLTQYLNHSKSVLAVSGNYIGSSQLRLTTRLNSLIQNFNQSVTSTNVALNVTAIATNSNSGVTLETKNFVVNVTAAPNPLGMVKATNEATDKMVVEIANWIQTVKIPVSKKQDAPDQDTSKAMNQNLPL